MDAALSIMAIERDWAALAAQCSRLGLGTPTREQLTVYVPVVPKGTTEQFIAVLECDDYDAVAPLLDFADPDDPSQRGAAYWPRITGAPVGTMNINGASAVFLCTPGTRAYHIHTSHHSERFERVTWKLPRVAWLIWHFTQRMGAYERRGV